MNDSGDAQILTRLCRQWFWLGLGVIVYAAATGAVLALATSARSAGVTVAVAVLMAGSPISAFWLEWRDAVRSRPARWLRRAGTVAAPHGAAISIACSVVLGGAIPAWLSGAVAAAVALAELGCVVMASRAVRYPLAPELGLMDVEVSVKIRSSQAWQPEWSILDEARLRDQELVLTLRTGFSWAVQVRLTLVDMTSVSARPARPTDSPWLRLDDGQEFFATPGDVVEIVNCRGATLAVPVQHAASFAAAISSRIEAIRDEACDATGGVVVRDVGG